MILLTSKFRSVALAGVALTALSACSDGLDGPTPSDRLVVWSTESDAAAKEVLADVKRQFEAQHPGTDLVIEYVGWGQVSEQLINARSPADYPDVSHIQPFMAYSLYSADLLLPFGEVRDELEDAHGPIFPAVRELQEYEGEVYGLAYAVGATFWSARADLIPDGVDVGSINTWDDYLQFVSEVFAESNSGATVTLPGGSPFFIDQLFSELVANAGGAFFDDIKCPTLESEEVVAALQFFSDLNDTGTLAGDWSTQTYLDQFSELGEADVFSVPVTYARASRSVIDVFENDPMLDASVVDDQFLLWIDQPSSTTGGASIATIDAEPWVIFSPAAERIQEDGTLNSELAKNFLRLFYAEQNYLNYTRSVPVHLTPIFETLATSETYVEATRPFESWHDRTLQRLSDGSTRPIMMPDLSETGRQLPYLLEFQRAGILSGAVSDVLEAGRTPTEAAERAQMRAVQLAERSTNTTQCRQ